MYKFYVVLISKEYEISFIMFMIPYKKDGRLHLIDASKH